MAGVAPRFESADHGGESQVAQGDRLTIQSPPSSAEVHAARVNDNLGQRLAGQDAEQFLKSGVLSATSMGADRTTEIAGSDGQGSFHAEGGKDFKGEMVTLGDGTQALRVPAAGSDQKVLVRPGRNADQSLSTFVETVDDSGKVLSRLHYDNGKVAMQEIMQGDGKVLTRLRGPDGQMHDMNTKDATTPITLDGNGKAKFHVVGGADFKGERVQLGDGSSGLRYSEDGHDYLLRPGTQSDGTPATFAEMVDASGRAQSRLYYDEGKLVKQDVLNSDGGVQSHRFFKDGRVVKEVPGS